MNDQSMAPIEVEPSSMSKAQISYETRLVPRIEILVDNEFNCRGSDLIPMGVVELAKDIEENGLINPIIIKPIDHPEFKFKLIAGFRRTLAHKINDTDPSTIKIMATIRPDISNEIDALVLNLSENLHRSSLTMVQEARAISKLEKHGMTREQWARRTQKSWGWIQVRLMLAALPGEIQNEVEALGKGITQQQVRDLYTYYKEEGKGKCEEVIRNIKSAKASGRKAITSPEKRDSTSKLIRNKTEILNMMDTFKRTFGLSLIVRFGAWSIGEISAQDLYDDIEAYCEKHNITFERPKDEDNENS